MQIWLHFPLFFTATLGQPISSNPQTVVQPERFLRDALCDQNSSQTATATLTTETDTSEFGNDFTGKYTLTDGPPSMKPKVKPCL